MSTVSSKASGSQEQKDLETPRFNRLGDEKWYITDETSSDILVLNWASYEGSYVKKLWAKEMVVFYSGGYVSEDGKLVARKSTIKGFVVDLRKILLFSSQRNITLEFHRWDRELITEMFRANLLGELFLSAQDKPDGLASRGSTNGLFTVINVSNHAFSEGAISDGFAICFHNRRNSANAMFGDLLKKHGVHIDAYFKGGSFGEVATEVAMLLLAEAIAVLRSDQTRAAVALCKVQRSPDQIRHDLVYGRESGNRVSLNKYMKQGRIFPEFRNHGHRRNAREKILRLDALFTEVIGRELSALFWNSHGEFVNYCAEVYEACAVIFLCLTGIRVSELCTIKVSDYEKRNSGEWIFKSQVDKTHAGGSEIRVMHGLVAEAADVLEALSYSDKRTDNVGLFSRNLCQNMVDRGEEGEYFHPKKDTVSSYVKRFYARFIDKHGDAVTTKNSSISPHQFRHSFAAFALRRFDGNVLEAIRQHFLHGEGSGYTKKYTDGKLTPSVMNQLERDYINELVARIATSEDQYEFVGGVALYIRKRVTEIIGDSHVFLPVGEFEEAVDEIARDFDIINAHEYGYCMFSSKRKSQALCRDPRTNLPDPHRFSGFSVCSGCPMNLVLQPHAEAIKRLGVAHQNFIQKHPLKIRSKAVDASKKAIKNAERILRELGEI